MAKLSEILTDPDPGKWPLLYLPFRGMVGSDMFSNIWKFIGKDIEDNYYKIDVFEKDITKAWIWKVSKDDPNTSWELYEEPKEEERYWNGLLIRNHKAQVKNNVLIIPYECPDIELNIPQDSNLMNFIKPFMASVKESARNFGIEGFKNG